MHPTNKFERIKLSEKKTTLKRDRAERLSKKLYKEKIKAQESQNELRSSVD